MKFKSWDKTIEIELLSCPFCGADPKLIHIGNDYTKKRSVEVKCTNMSCRISRRDSALIHGFDFLEKASEKSWNKRINQKGEEE